MKCGDANPNGNIALNYKGGCGKELLEQDVYRCTGCGGKFHYTCILKHFELEDGHDNAKNAIGKIIKYILKQSLKGHSLNKQYLLRLCDNGLTPNKLLLKKHNEKK